MSIYSISDGMAKEIGLQKDRDRCQRFTGLVLQICSARCWSQIHHSLCLPHAFASVFVTTEAEQSQASKFLKQIAKTLKAVHVAKDRFPKNESLKQYVFDLGTFAWVLTREMLVEGEQQKWDVTSSELRELAWAVFASGAETKSTCENSFSWLADTSERQSKSDKMSDYTKYLYLETCPYAKDGGTHTVQPLPSDIKTWTPEDNLTVQSLGLFSRKHTPLPFDHITPHMIRQWRPAGFKSQRVAAAAMAFGFGNTDAQGNFNVNRLETIWSGVLLSQNHVFYDKQSKSFFFSLGFMEYAVMALRMDVVEYCGDVFCSYLAILLLPHKTYPKWIY